MSASTGSRLGTIALVALGVVLLTGGAATWEIWWVSRSVELEGRVIRSQWQANEGALYVVEYPTEQGKATFIERPSLHLWLEHSVGDMVRIRYRADAPDETYIKDWRADWGTTLSFGGGGLAVLVIIALNAFVWNRPQP